MQSTFFRSYFFRVCLCVSVIWTAVPSRAFATFHMCNSLFDSTIPETTGRFQNKTSEVDGRTVFYKHLRAAAGQPTAIVFMGLFTPIADYVGFQKAFAKLSRGEGLILFSYGLMPESLAAHAELNSGDPAKTKRLTLNDLAREGTAVINSAGISGPVTAVGYSFGAAPAARFAAFHRGRVNNLVLAAPLVIQGDHEASLINGGNQLKDVAALNPLFGRMLLETARESIARHSAGTLVRQHFDTRSWPGSVDRQSIVDGVALRIRSTEEFDLREEDFDSWPRTHFLLSDRENPLRLNAQIEVVNGMIDAAQRAPAAQAVERIPSVTLVEDSGHGVLGLRPIESARMILKVMRGRL